MKATLRSMLFGATLFASFVCCGQVSVVSRTYCGQLDWVDEVQLRFGAGNVVAIEKLGNDCVVKATTTNGTVIQITGSSTETVSIEVLREGKYIIPNTAAQLPFQFVRDIKSGSCKCPADQYAMIVEYQ